MKCSELIERLTELNSKFGDVDVDMMYDNGKGYADIERCFHMAGTVYISSEVVEL